MPSTMPSPTGRYFAALPPGHDHGPCLNCGSAVRDMAHHNDDEAHPWYQHGLRHVAMGMRTCATADIIAFTAKVTQPPAVKPSEIMYQLPGCCFNALVRGEKCPNHSPYIHTEVIVPERKSDDG